MIGSRLSHFHITAKLGQGGMGEVYRAADERLGRDVAIKILPPELTADPERLARLQREARILASLSHANIAALYDIGEKDGVHYLVMELAEGETLDQRIARGPLPAEDALRAAIRIARALESAHERGIVHRDLKPANVVIDAQGQVKLLDFGLARAIEGDPVGTASASGPSQEHSPTLTARHTAAGMILGTAAYMSPEQARGKPVDRRSDVWAFGVVLWEMLAGRRLFSGETVSDTLAAVLRAEIEWDPLPATVPQALRNVLRRCLERDPDRRLHDVADARIVLEEILEGGGALEEAAVAPAPRRPLGWIAAAFAAGAIVVWAALQLAGRPSGGAEAADAVPAMTFRQVTEQHGAESQGSLAPDGESFLYTKPVDGQRDIFLQRVGGRNAINLTEDCAEDDHDPAFSPDGRQIAFRSERSGGGIFVMGATGESVRKVTGEGYTPAWSPDGTKLVVGDESPVVPWGRAVRGHLTVVDVETGERTVIGERDGVDPAWSRDGRWIVSWGLPASETWRDLHVIAADGSTRDADDAIALTDDRFLDWSPVWSPDGRQVYFSSSRGGTFNVWRIAVDPATGRPAGDPRPLTVPSSWAGDLSLSADGRRLLFLDRNIRQKSWRLRLGADGEVRGTPIEVPFGSFEQGGGPEPSPDGDLLVTANSGYPQHLYVVDADGDRLRQLTEGEHRDRQGVFSPDGEWILFQTDRYPDSILALIRTDGSGLRPAGGPSSGAYFPRFAPDGRSVVFTTQQGPFRFEPWADDPTATLEALPLPGEGMNFQPTGFSPDGRKLIGTVLRGTRVLSLSLLDPATGRYETLLEADRLNAAQYVVDGRHVIHVEDRAVKLLDLDDRTRRTLFEAAGRTILGPSLSADGEWLVWTELADESDLWLAEMGAADATMRARSVYWLIPAQWLAHFADEWTFGFPAWATRHFEPLPDSLWVPGMIVMSVPMIVLGWAASRPSAGPAPRLLCAGIQTIFFTNAFFHGVTTFVFGEYSPGTATGIVLFLPLSLSLWRAVLREPGTSRRAFAAALVGGFVVHGLAVLSLFVDKSGWVAY